MFKILVTTKFSDRVVNYAQTVRELVVNSSGRCGRMRASAWHVRAMPRLSRIVHEQLTSSSRVVHDYFFIWRAQVSTTPSELRKLVVPMREVRKLCANYAQTMRELIVPVRVNVDTDGHAFVNYS